MYCEKCKHISADSQRCKYCGYKHMQIPSPDSMCYLCEKQQIWADMLKDVLQQHNIPFSTRAKLGGAIAATLGQSLESYIFYIRYEHLEQAQDIVCELFGECFQQGE